MSEASSAPIPLEAEHGKALLREMLRIRRFEEKCAELYQQTSDRKSVV